MQTKATTKFGRHKKVTVNAWKSYVYVHLENLTNQKSISLRADEMELLLEIFAKDFAEIKKTLNSKISSPSPKKFCGEEKKEKEAKSVKETIKRKRISQKATTSPNKFIQSEAWEIKNHLESEEEEQVLPAKRSMPEYSKLIIITDSEDSE